MNFLAQIIGISLSEYLPIQNQTTRLLMGSALSGFAYAWFSKIPSVEYFFKKLFYRYSNHKYLILSKDVNNPLCDRLETYVVNKYKELLIRCKIAEKNGEINFTLDNAFFKKTIQENYGNHIIYIHTDISHKDLERLANTNNNSSSNERNEALNLNSIIISSKTASLDEMKAFVSEKTMLKVDSKITRVFRSHIDLGDEHDDGKKKKHKTSASASWKEIHVISNTRIANTILSEKNNKEFYDDVKSFMTEKKDLYNKNGWSWKRGYLVYGPPGTGKTSAIRAIANEFPDIYGIYTIDLAAVADCNNANSIFTDLMSQIHISSQNKPFILALEDADRADIWPKKTRWGYEDPQGKLDIGCLLNEIDGIVQQEGRILIVTCNDKEILENVPQGALMRPGRIDKKVCFDYCDFNQAKKIIQNYYKNIENGEFPEDITEENYEIRPEMSPCTVVNLLQLLGSENLKFEDLKTIVFKSKQSNLNPTQEQENLVQQFGEIINKTVLNEDDPGKSFGRKKSRKMSKRRRKFGNDPDGRYRKRKQTLSRNKIRLKKAEKRLNALKKLIETSEETMPLAKEKADAYKKRKKEKKIKQDKKKKEKEKKENKKLKNKVKTTTKKTKKKTKIVEQEKDANFIIDTPISTKKAASKKRATPLKTV